MGWPLLIIGGVITVIPGMFQVVNGATLFGLILVVVGTVLLLNEERQNG